MPALLVGDLHIGRYPQNVPVSYRHWDIVFDQIDEVLDEIDVDEAVFLGDVFESTSPSLEDLQYFAQKLKNLQKRVKRIFVLMGNHCYRSEEYNNLNWFKMFQTTFNSLKKCKFVDSYHSQELSIGPCEFLPWPQRKPKNKGSVVFAHISINGALSDNGFKLKSDTTISKNNRWYIGDIHAPQQGDNYVYVGAPLQLRYGDGLDRFLMLVSKRKGKLIDKWIPIKTNYILQVVNAIELEDCKKIYRELEKRPDHAFTKIKASPEVYASPYFSKFEKLDRILIEPISKKRSKDDDTEPLVTDFTDSLTLRRKLVRKRLKSLPVDKRKRANQFISRIEDSIRKEAG